MKKILLTGSSGFIGTNFIQYIHRHNIPIYILGVDNYPSKIHYPHFSFLNKGVIDLTSADISGCTTILHLAARTGVRQSTLEAQDYLQQNVAATHHLLELAVKVGIQRVFFASSSSVYGDHPGQPEGEFPIDSISCKSFYALTKQQCETLSYYYSKKHGLTCAALRFFTVYGPSPRKDMLIGQVIHSAIQKNVVSFFGDPSETLRSFTYVDDVIRCILLLLEYQELPTWSAWNIGNPENVSCRYVLDCLTNELGKHTINYSLQYTEKNSLDTCETRANITKATRLLNWSPRVSIEEGIQKTVASFHFT
jgi:UDP-glucuronate 4-epimerase